MAAQAEPESAREIVTTRLFDAPRERVFAAWSSAAHLDPTVAVRAEVIERYHADEDAEQNLDRMVDYVRAAG